MNIVKQNRIVFKRISDINVLGYEIKCKQIIDGVEITSSIIKIDNKPNPDPIKIKQKLEYNKTLIYDVPADIYWNNDYKVSVHINGKRLIDALVLHNTSRNNIEILYRGVTEFDIIEVEYYYDGIEFFHNTDKPSEYAVELIIDYTSNSIGNHNILV